MGAEPEIGPTDPTGRSSGRDHSSFNGLARGDRNITFRSLPALVRTTIDTRGHVRKPRGQSNGAISFTSKTTARLSTFEEEEEAEVREDDEGVGPDGEVVIKEYTVELELDVGIEDVSTTEPVERKAGLLKELLVTEVELDDVAVVSATVGIGRSLSV